MRTFRIILLISIYEIHVSAVNNNLSLLSRVNHDNDQLLYLEKALIHIFRDCWNKYETLMVSIADNEYLHSKFMEKIQTSMSLILSGTDFLTNYSRIVDEKKIDGLVIFFQHELNHRNLTDTMEKFSMTPWKKFMPYVFVIDKSKNSCGKSEMILSSIWRINLIAYYICLDINENFLIFTYNPFSLRTPEQWEIMKTYEIRNNNWTLYARAYKKENICDQLDFDRTKYLDGYKILIASRVKRQYAKYYSKILPPEKIETAIEMQSKLFQAYTRGIVSSLNVSAYFYVIPYIDHLSMKSVQNLSSLLLNLGIDVVIQPFTMAINWIPGYDFTFPARSYQSGIIVHHRGFKTPLEKIRDFYGIWTLLFTTFVLIVTFIVVWLVEKRRIYFAAFEIIRLLVTTSLNTRMNTVPRRIFFGTIFIYFLIIHATFSGHLAEFLTKPELRKHPETLQDLISLGYRRIFGLSPVNYSLVILEGNDKVQFIIDSFCWTRIKNDTEAACITDHTVLSSINWWDDYRTSYYVNKKPFGFQYSHYLIRSEWLLTDRTNKILMWIWEANLQRYWQMNRASLSFHASHVFEAELEVDFSAISLDQLTFAFILLGVGLTCATIAFIIELYVKHKKIGLHI